MSVFDSLSDKERENFIFFQQKLTLDNATSQNAAAFYLEHKSKSDKKFQIKNNVELNIATAILIADRAIEMEDLQGNKIRGTGLNVMKLLEDTVYSFDQMINNLKNFLKIVSVDKEVKSDLEKIISDFSMKLTLFKKYEKVLISL